eukprot:1159668-Pelagomonas_calceolata.AAC.2
MAPRNCVPGSCPCWAGHRPDGRCCMCQHATGLEGNCKQHHLCPGPVSLAMTGMTPCSFAEGVLLEKHEGGPGILTRKVESFQQCQENCEA